MILDLSIKKQLNFDDGIRKYLPNLYPNAKDRIKIGHLINHTSGIHEYVELLDQQGLVWWKHFGLDNDKVIKLLEGQKSLKFKPGTKYNYSNSNYNILAKIIDIASKEWFTNYSEKKFKTQV